MSRHLFYFSLFFQINIQQMRLKMSNIFWSYLRKHSSTFLVWFVRPFPLFFFLWWMRKRGHQINPSQRTLALVLLSILHLIDSHVTLPHCSWKLRLSTWAVLLFIDIDWRGEKVLLWWKQSFSIRQSCQRYSNANIKLERRLIQCKQECHVEKKTNKNRSIKCGRPIGLCQIHLTLF